MADAKRETKAGSTSREPWHVEVWIEELKHEIRMRESFFGRQVRDGKMPQTAADFRIRTLEELVRFLELVQDGEGELLRKTLGSTGFVPVDTIESLILDWRRDLAARVAARPAPADETPIVDAPITGVTGGQKSLLVYGETRGSA